MLHHPIALGAKLVLLFVIIIVLIVLHGVLTPGQFRVAVFIAAGVFVVGAVVVWIVAYRVMSNPQSRLGGQFVLWKQERSEDGYTSPDEFRELVGQHGVTLSPLRPSGTAEFDGKRLSVVTESEFIERGATVEVVEAAGSRVVVRRAAMSVNGES